ncbi:tannase/feruloyl esterase family alpha/beta hydrolase [Nocardia concava]|uniref:tannase/feruloyl esterase family alpha/beta hydrolase n=1 Tax=Nocardia concava TaxID=257281 RepID=UPI0002E66DF2|nr:tannase/feruloyl esterase family alpha/beta hydrolase [Nocardia concava]
MKRRLLTLATVGLTVAGAAAVYALVDGSRDSTAASPNAFNCNNFQIPAPEGAAVESLTATAVPAATFQVPGTPPLGGYPVPEVPAHCEVTVTLTHTGANDHAKVQVWLPESGWNGRFQAVGGAAYAAGNVGGVATAVKQGYAAATTDAGVDTSGLDTSWALNSSGQINSALLENFASRSVHELAVVGKQVVSEVYGKDASYAYWNGCSTGGRQGYMEAQKYPADFNGINADAPAINWNQFEVASLWPQVVMNEAHTYPSACEFNAFNQAAVKECDPLDGVADGLISDPGKCGFDPRRLIGTKVQCDGQDVTITEADAEVVRKIWDGPRDASGKQLWFGLPTGADFSALTASTTANGVTTGVPFIVPAQWVSTFVAKQPKFDTAHLTYAQFDQIFQQARAEYDSIIGTANPDLSAFRAAGGKLITWQGDADQLIPPAGTVDYRHRVEAQMGGTDKVDEFYRVFLAPGVAHCALTGSSDMTALTEWVEHGKAPEVLQAGLTTATGQTVTRDICRLPLVSRYSGDGDPASPASFRCVAP